MPTAAHSHLYSVQVWDIIDIKLTGRKWCGKKRCTCNSSVLELTFKRGCRIPNVKSLLYQRRPLKHLTWNKKKTNRTVAQWSKVLFSGERKFCIWFENQAPRFWGEEWRGPVCYLVCHVIFWCWSTVFLSSQHSRLPAHFRALPSAGRLYGDADFIFQQQDITPAHNAKTTTRLFADHHITVLSWTAISPDLSS